MVEATAICSAYSISGGHMEGVEVGVIILPYEWHMSTKQSTIHRLFQSTMPH